MIENTQPDSMWSASQVLLLAAAGGAFGGLVEFLAAFQVKEGILKIRGELHSAKLAFQMIIIQILIGICGAFAVLFVFSSTTWFPSTDTAHNELWIVTLSVVAGFGARRFLPIVTKRLEAKINDLEEKIEQERVDTALNFERDRIREIVSQALAVLAPEANPTPTELHTHGMKLRELLKKHPLERLVVIVAGRVNRRLNELNEAINLQSDFLARKENAKQLDEDYADVLYNRACYKCQLWDTNGDARLIDSGVSDIQLAIEYNRSNRSAVEEDEDFNPWREQPAFKAALEKR